MKYYDYKKARRLIEANKENLSSANLGMHEDWFWTAQPVWEDGEYKHDLPDDADERHEAFIREKKSGELNMFLEEKDSRGISKLNPKFFAMGSYTISGIYGSVWATPVIQLCFRDGSDKMIECHDGGVSDGESLIELGCLSGPVQDEITPISEDE